MTKEDLLRVVKLINMFGILMLAIGLFCNQGHATGIALISFSLAYSMKNVSLWIIG